MNLLPFRLAAILGCLLACPALAHAQLFEHVGVRARGMAGAFVAVADDATATWWNPAGLATGPFFSGSVEQSRGEDGDRTVGVAFAVPSLGLGYYRLRLPALSAPGAAGATGAAQPALVTMHQLGVTVGQSLGEHLVVASTLKLLRADQTRGDLDLGAMASFGSMRAAVVVRRLREPELTAGGVPLDQRRQVRIGTAYVPSSGAAGLILGVDADLTETAAVDGEVRHLAVGVEVGGGRTVAVRGGLSVNTIGATRQAWSVGTSVAVDSGVLVDLYLTRGDDAALEGWGLGLRLTF